MCNTTGKEPAGRRRRQIILAPILLACAAASRLPAAEPVEWSSLFDGRTLGKWAVVDRYDFKRHGAVTVKDGQLILEAGSPGTAVRWTDPFPTTNYELSLEAMRVSGEDFFCGLTFPVNGKALTLIVGGWGGKITGLSSIDGEPAVENETCRNIDFGTGRWYHIRLRVTPANVSAWLDQEKIIDLEIEDHELSLVWEVEPCLPLGVATWRTTGALRKLRLRKLDAAAEGADP